MPMDPRAQRQQIFRPLNDAVSDTWLQVRAKPLIYILIWVSLALAPYILLGLAFQGPLVSALDEYFGMLEQLDFAALGVEGEMPSEYLPLTLKILGFYALILALLALVGVFMGAVMAGTISRFRDRSFPRYFEALRDGAGLYPGFLISVLFTVGRILARPLAVGAVSGLLALAAGSGTISTVGFLVAFFLLLSDINRFGLSPFIHLSLGSNARDSIGISKSFYMSHRPVISSLFLSLIMLPLVFLMLLYSLFLSSGFFFNGGAFIIWFLQSVAQFAIVMILINFARNTFIRKEVEPGTGSDIEGEAVVVEDTGPEGDAG